ncbi:chaperone protein dnaJ 20, chloroplastic-like [Cryptomeria japonica]|uniref:chaperone protein dnaJ 20, chloroplastic-like n=1 Tax=Cryptomeria japonica TaxID=3369 RepID=UPI0027DA875F|nr:chaperone protein dnaJ 20, chloroplastic-like [Cryptomeria japonica]
MEYSASIKGLQASPRLMSKCASSGISRVRIGVRPKHSTSIRAFQSQNASFPSSSSLYDVLCVSPDVSAIDIKRAYRRMALKYHPDVCPAAEKEECSKWFLQVQEAYETLSDPLLRQDYDWRLQNRFTVGNYEGRLESSHVWEAQLMELIRRRSGNNSSSWGSRMRRRNQEGAYACF